MKRILPFLLLATALRADITLPAIFSDNMVLQQLQLTPIWGTAESGESIKVTFGEQTHSTTAGRDGKWRVTFNPLNASAEPSDITLTGKNTLTIKNVLVGEVWVCSGQSNMAMTVNRTLNADAELAAANHPQIRMFNVERVTNMTPQADCKGAWRETTSANVADFSAVAFFFGRHLHQVLKVPVGLINTSWGGTRIEAWTSSEALKDRPCAQEMLADWQNALSSGTHPCSNPSSKKTKLTGRPK